MIIRIHSGSMEPTIRTGETVAVLDGLPRPGDVAAIEHDGVTLVHRIHARLEMGGRLWLIHRGDNSLQSGLADAREVLGVVPGLWRKPAPPRNLLLLRLGALFRHLGLRKSIARRIARK